MENEWTEEELAEAYAHEDLSVRSLHESWGMALMFAIVPLALGLMVLSRLLGEWIWKALPLVWVLVICAPFLLRFAMRWRSELPIDLPGHGRLSGRRKKRAILAAGTLFVAVAVFVELVWPWLFVEARALLLGWGI